MRFGGHRAAAGLTLVFGVMGLISCGFILFTLLTSNPFERLLPAAVEGRDLNPLLQDIGLAIHPPMLYLGYVGFSVIACFLVVSEETGDFGPIVQCSGRPPDEKCNVACGKKCCLDGKRCGSKTGFGKAGN